MITIPCSILEQVRQAPGAHAQIIAITEKPQTRGSYGMFAYWKDAVKLVHTGQATIMEAIRFLENKFIQFNDNVPNRTKQAYLLDHLPIYCAAYKKRGFRFIDAKHKMKWEIVEGVRLTGHTPWVVFDGDQYYSYFITDNDFDWRSELRFPLIQQYLTDNHIDCTIDQLQVGTYCLEKKNFDFKNFSKREINLRINETGDIFNTVLNEYRKYKK